MKVLALLASLLFNCVYASENLNEVGKIITKLFPKYSKERALEIGKYIEKYSKEYGLDKWRSTAIGMQESVFRDPKPKQFIVFDKRCFNSHCGEVSRLERGYRDVGIWQFWVQTIKDYNLNPILLKNDINYATESHFKILSIKINICKDSKHPWTCYHSFNKKLRRRYKEDVNYWYRKIMKTMAKGEIK